MIAAWSEWGGLGPAGEAPGKRIARSLGLYSGHAADFCETDGVGCAALSQPRAKPQSSWRPARSVSGWRVVFNGYLDNASEMAARLGLDGQVPPDQVYAAALDRWGDDTDLQCIGVYCSAAISADCRTLRLARSPYEAPPLFYHRTERWSVAASVPRALFAIGVPRELDGGYLIRTLLLQVRDSGPNWYRGIDRVGTGETVTLSSKGSVVRRYYDPARFVLKAERHADAPDRAWELLGEAAGRVANTFEVPGMLLSGGLDSPLASLALLEALPADRSLPTFTFTPCAGWDGILTPNLMGNERPLVEALAARYPRLQPRFFANEGRGIDHGWREVFAASDVATPGMPNSYINHVLWEAARESGCDGVVTAEFANLSYSTAARWAPADYLRRVRWRQMLRSLAAAPGDDRSFPRRFAARAVLPNLPAWAQRLSRRMRNRHISPEIAAAPLRRELRDSPEAFDEHGVRLDPFAGFSPRDHWDYVGETLTLGTDYAADVHQAFEQIHGIRRRDLTLYRPLIEFCLSLSTEEFELDGVDRRLARRMAEGRIPAEINANRRYGRHGVDWHARIGPRRPELLARLRALQDFPDAAELIDLDGAIRALENWPDQTTYDREVTAGIHLTMTRALLMGGFLNYVHGRNDL